MIRGLDQAINAVSCEDFLFVRETVRNGTAGVSPSHLDNEAVNDNVEAPVETRGVENSQPTPNCRVLGDLVQGLGALTLKWLVVRGPRRQYAATASMLCGLASIQPQGVSTVD